MDYPKAICNECLPICNEILEGKRKAGFSQLPRPEPPLPAAIKEFLDGYVIGQDRAKKILSVAVYNHEKRKYLNRVRSLKQAELPKADVLLIGPTGSGKTHLVRTLARVLDVPYATVDATTLTEHGYVGEDVENILEHLLAAANGELAKAQNGIVYLDEIDKIGKPDGSNDFAVGRDVSGEGVQQCLLRILEGTVVRLPNRKEHNGEGGYFDTSNVLFICGGTFVGLDKMIARRIGRQVIGFTEDEGGSQDQDMERHVRPQDLIQFGLIPELIGRLPVVGVFDELDKAALVNILTQPKDALVKQYQRLARGDGVQLEFTDDAFSAIADKALAKKIGARGLRKIMEELMLDLMYLLPDSKVKSVAITKEFVLASPERQKELAVRMTSSVKKAAAGAA